MTPNLSGRALATAALAALALAAGASGTRAVAAASAPAAQAAHPDLSGFWEVMDDSKRVTPASLTPEAQAAQAAARAAARPGQIVGFASRWCHHLGVPFIMGDSAPLDILQTPRETAIMAEVQSAARHIYTDGRGHPDPETYDPTTNGHSIGHWEGDTFVVDTVGFNDKGNTGIPGGGNRGPNSHLVERYRLIEGGKKLSVTFTWTDPTQFTRPHTYEFVYYKSPPETYALEYFCDASDAAARSGSVVPPPQD
jgi:hypothetical protein